jgi:hypothetical protein
MGVNQPADPLRVASPLLPPPPNPPLPPFPVARSVCMLCWGRASRNWGGEGVWPESTPCSVRSLMSRYAVCTSPYFTLQRGGGGGFVRFCDQKLHCTRRPDGGAAAKRRPRCCPGPPPRPRRSTPQSAAAAAAARAREASRPPGGPAARVSRSVRAAGCALRCFVDGCPGSSAGAWVNRMGGPRMAAVPGTRSLGTTRLPAHSNVPCARGDRAHRIPCPRCVGPQAVMHASLTIGHKFSLAAPSDGAAGGARKCLARGCERASWCGHHVFAARARLRGKWMCRW